MVAQEPRQDELALGPSGERRREREEIVEPLGSVAATMIARGRGTSGHLARRQRGVVTEDRLLELTQGRARLDAELFDEQAPGLAIDLERFGLPSRAVERLHERPAKPLAERVLRTSACTSPTSSA